MKGVTCNDDSTKNYTHNSVDSLSATEHCGVFQLTVLVLRPATLLF